MTKRILLADDSVTMQKAVEIALAMEPVQLQGVTAPAKIIAKVQEFRPDLLIMDSSFPGASGYDLCRALLGNPGTASLKIAMLTGPAEADAAQRAADSGAVGFITKPFDTATFITKVNEYLAVPSKSQPGVAAARPATSSQPPAPAPAPAARPAPAPAPAPAAARTPAPVKPIDDSAFADLQIGGEATEPVDAEEAFDFGGTIAPTPAPAPAPQAAARPAAPAPARPPAPTPAPAVMPQVTKAPLAPVAPTAAAAPRPSPAPAPAPAAPAPAAMPANLEALTREAIEKAVWEIVPELAEAIIRDEINKLLRERAQG